jgi:hypothetical protein
MSLARETVLMLLVVGLLAAGGAANERKSLVPPVRLPDGTEFQTWEVPRVLVKTYYVDQANPKASDDNPGTQALPLKTINAAARVLQPGERVVVAAGVYRERVRPARGGAEPARMIGYEAAAGAEVVLSGSRVVNTPWTPSHRDGQDAGAGIWMTRLPSELFAEENPFREVNLTDETIDRGMDWALPIKGKVPNTLRRGLVFQDGKRLQQTASYKDLAKTRGTYWVEADGLTLHVRPLDGADPNRARFEATTQGFVFAPEKIGLGYIRVKGFTIQHSGNCFPRPQQGALSTQRGHHWIIEENTIRQCNSIGMDIGDQTALDDPELAEGGQQIVRRNTVTDCGIGGIEGKGIERTLIEDNTIRRCGWQNIWLLYETGGIKVHCTRSCLLRRNLITDTIAAPGIWMDYTNANSRCSGNIIINADCSNGGIFVEASQKPNMVDTNFVWGTRGSGIYQHDCDELIVAHNFVGKSSDAAVRMQICQGRIVDGRLSTAKRNKILNNVFFDNALPLAISDRDNLCDNNVFSPPPAKPFDLARWQKTTGWDKQSLATTLHVELLPATLELSWTGPAQWPAFPSVPGVTHDFWRRPLDREKVAPGPFGVIQPAESTVRLAPR